MKTKTEIVNTIKMIAPDQVNLIFPEPGRVTVTIIGEKKGFSFTIDKSIIKSGPLKTEGKMYDGVADLGQLLDELADDAAPGLLSAVAVAALDGIMEEETPFAFYACIRMKKKGRYCLTNLGHLYNNVVERSHLCGIAMAMMRDTTILKTRIKEIAKDSIYFQQAA